MILQFITYNNSPIGYVLLIALILSLLRFSIGRITIRFMGFVGIFFNVLGPLINLINNNFKFTFLFDLALYCSIYFMFSRKALGKLYAPYGIFTPPDYYRRELMKPQLRQETAATNEDYIYGEEKYKEDEKIQDFVQEYDTDKKGHPIISIILQILFGIYYIGAGIGATYFNYLYAVTHGFWRWLIFGEIIATIQGALWPYYVIVRFL